MIKKSTRRLALKLETLKQLELGIVVGGSVGASCAACSTQCPTPACPLTVGCPTRDCTLATANC